MGSLKGILWTAAVMCLFIAAAVNAAAPGEGAAELELEGGRFGDVPFPHRQHQDTLTDCTVCHEWFPQSKGSIEKLKSEGTLKPRDVMNKLCLKCHRDLKRQGKASGPTSCTTCHQQGG